MTGTNAMTGEFGQVVYSGQVIDIPGVELELLQPIADAMQARGVGQVGFYIILILVFGFVGYKIYRTFKGSKKKS